jgi:hypothetical protein
MPATFQLDSARFTIANARAKYPGQPTVELAHRLYIHRHPHRFGYGLAAMSESAIVDAVQEFDAIATSPDAHAVSNYLICA